MLQNLTRQNLSFGRFYPRQLLICLLTYFILIQYRPFSVLCKKRSLLPKVAHLISCLNLLLSISTLTGLRGYY